jgi:hypothetical protein
VRSVDPTIGGPFRIFAGAGHDIGLRRGAVNDNSPLLCPMDELADLHHMLDKHSVPRVHAGQELSLQGRVQEFAFKAAAGAVKIAQRAGFQRTAPTPASRPPPAGRL